MFDNAILGRDLIYTFELGVIVGMAAHKHADNTLLRRTHVAAANSQDEDQFTDLDENEDFLTEEDRRLRDNLRSNLDKHIATY